MADHTPPTEQQLDEIAAREQAATPGPWGFYDGETYADVAADLEQTGPGSYSYREKVARLEDENYWDDQAHEDHDEERAPEQMAANAAFIAHAREDVRVLLAEVRALRSERDELRGKFADAAASLAEQVLRFGQRQREHNADREELERLRTALTQIQRLHTDSPMGPCPVCIDADALAAGGDGLVPYPCPTGRLAGNQDCDPPHVRAAAETAQEA